MATFALVSSGMPAISAAGPAYLMFRASAGFAASWERATKEADSALILSPDYGLLYADEVVGPGDGALGDERWQENADAWLGRIERELLTLRWLEAQHRWLLLGEGDWLAPVATYLRENGQEVLPPSANATSR